MTFRIFGLYRKDSRTKVGDYVRLAAKIVGEDLETRTYNQIMAALHDLGAANPIANAVNEGLSGKDCYEESPEMCRYVLWLYEEHLARKLGAGATVDEHERTAIWKKRASDSIEHIFPQSPWGEAGWRGKMRREGQPEEPVFQHVGRIGNLLLLPIKLGLQAGTKPFDDKKLLYEKHNLRMVKEVCSETDWTLDQIEARETRIIKWALTMWADL